MSPRPSQPSRPAPSTAPEPTDVPVPEADRRAFAGAPAHWRLPMPPRWLPRALTMTVVAVFAAVLVWRAAGMLGNVITILVISWFVSLAMEPLILWLGRHRVRRSLATGIVMIGGLIVAIGVLTLLGGMFVSQLVDLVQSIPDFYREIRQTLDERFEIQLPRTNELISTVSDYADDIGVQALAVTTSIAGGIFNFTAVLLVVYYMASAGPRFRASVCRYLAPHRQREVLRIWEVSQDKVAGFINSRLVLAAISSAATFAFLTILGIDFALPLAIFTGLVSQFIPTIGTYIGGAAPVLIALISSPIKALAVLAFIVAYQQIENLILSPKISQRSLSLNPAVAFLAVLGFGAVFGALGAFLSLPVAATIQAVMSTYVRRHELVDSELLTEEPTRKKKGDGAEDQSADDETAADRPEDTASSEPGQAPTSAD